MKLSGEIWRELGVLAQYVELVDHDNGTVQFRDGTTTENIAAVEAVIAAHDPLKVSPEKVQRDLEAALDAYINSVARAKGYDSRITATLRAGYPNPWQAEGIAFGQWMDNCYMTAYSILAAVQSGHRGVPTEAELIAEMPPMVWPA